MDTKHPQPVGALPQTGRLKAGCSHDWLPHKPAKGLILAGRHIRELSFRRKSDRVLVNCGKCCEAREVSRGVHRISVRIRRDAVIGERQ